VDAAISRNCSCTFASLTSKPVSKKIAMRKAEFIVLTACSMMLTALGIDIMLPVLGEVRDHFGLAANSTTASQVILFFFLGQIAQLVFGIFSDRYGRLPILRIGFPLYILGGVAATYAPTLALMFAARFVAGVGASAVLMATIAGVRDRFVGDEMARTMSMVLTVFLFTPVLAPFLGIGIMHLLGWRAVFLTPPVFAALVFLWTLRLKESHPKEKRTTLDRASIWKSMRTVFTSSVFLRYSAITTILFIGLSSYVASSEHIVGEIFKRPSLFAWIFAGIGLTMSIFSLTNVQLSKRFGARLSVKWLLLAYTVVATILLIYSLFHSDSPGINAFVICVALMMGLNIAIEPNSAALAMEPMGDVAGIAASIYNTLFFFVGSSIGAIISALMTSTVMPLIIAFFLIGILCLMLVLTDHRPLTGRKQTADEFSANPAAASGDN